jgi:RNase P subunit RPR2
MLLVSDPQPDLNELVRRSSVFEQEGDWEQAAALSGEFAAACRAPRLHVSRITALARQAWILNRNYRRAEAIAVADELLQTTSPLLIRHKVKDMSLVSRKNQVTIPANVMRDAGLEPGDDIRVRTIGPGRIEFVKTDELIADFAGRLDVETYPAGYLDDVRSGWG